MKPQATLQTLCPFTHSDGLKHSVPTSRTKRPPSRSTQSFTNSAMRRGAQPHDNPDKDFRTTLESSASKQSSTSKRKKATADAAGKNSSNTRQVDHGNQQAHRRPFVTSEMSQAAEGTGSKCERTSRQQQINKNGHNRQPAENIDMIEDGTLEKSDTTGIEHAKLEQGHNKKTDPAICDRCENSSELSPLCDKSPDCNRCRSDGFGT